MMPKLIPEGLSGWWRKYSAAALALIVSIQVAWKMSDDLQTMMPKDWLDTATLALAVLGFIGRFIAQTNVVPESKAEANDGQSG
jgi:hypothetical protein